MEDRQGLQGSACLGAEPCSDLEPWWRAADRGGKRLMLVMNPQWQPDGQVVSDFVCAACSALPRRREHHANITVCMHTSVRCVRSILQQTSVRRLHHGSCSLASASKCWLLSVHLGRRALLVSSLVSLRPRRLWATFEPCAWCGACASRPALTRRAPTPTRRFGRAKLEAEAFVGDFRDVCVMQRLRVMGDDVRLYKCYPGDWQARTRAAVQRAQRSRPAAAQARSARSSACGSGRRRHSSKKPLLEHRLMLSRC